MPKNRRNRQSKFSPDYIPVASKHASGQAVLRMNGRDYYLGKFGTQAAKEEYDRLIQEWLARGRQPVDDGGAISVNELILAYWRHATAYYRKADGQPTSELHLIKLAMRPLKSLYGTTPANEFGPLALKAVRQAMIDNNLCRKIVNDHTGRIKRMIKWGVEQELVPPSLYHGLQAVSGLRKGRSDARETEPVKPVADFLVDAVRPFVSSQVWTMIELQRLTGMRPGEVTQMRTCDLETTGRAWVYRPRTHKTEHHGREREIYVGPKAQAILTPWLKTDLQAFLFNPSEAEDTRNGKRQLERKNPMTPSQRKRKRKANRKRPWGVCYDVCAYRRAIKRATDKAFPLPEHLGQRNGESIRAWRARLTADEKEQIKQWHKQHTWHQHQLRHNAATNLRREHGVELARIILGHTNILQTQIYAEVDRVQAMEIMSKIG